jgi:hypothetical protein
MCMTGSNILLQRQDAHGTQHHMNEQNGARRVYAMRRLLMPALCFAFIVCMALPVKSEPAKPAPAAAVKPQSVISLYYWQSKWSGDVDNVPSAARQNYSPVIKAVIAIDPIYSFEARYERAGARDISPLPATQDRVKSSQFYFGVRRRIKQFVSISLGYQGFNFDDTDDTGPQFSTRVRCYRLGIAPVPRLKKTKMVLKAEVGIGFKCNSDSTMPGVGSYSNNGDSSDFDIALSYPFMEDTASAEFGYRTMQFREKSERINAGTMPTLDSKIKGLYLGVSYKL